MYATIEELLEMVFSESHAITNIYPEAVAVVQQVHKVLNDIEILAECTTAKVGESSECTYSVVGTSNSLTGHS
jgi:N-acetylmuramic acid 6-phosphate (MurNAc-6-P) etherase